MKFPQAWIVAGALVTMTQAATLEASLPVWKDGERLKMEKDGWVAGAALLTENPADDAEAESDDKTLDLPQPTAGEIAEPENLPEELPEKFWSDYFGEKPKSYLVDPQGLLGQMDHRERLTFLNYHAGDSSIDLYVYVFKENQEIPGEVREEELIERFFSEGRPAAVVYYYMSAPQLSAIYLSPSIIGSMPATEPSRALESSIMQAIGKTDPSRQIEAFLVQMSIRIYWMEKILGLGTAAAEPVAEPASRPDELVQKPNLMSLLLPWIDKAKPMVLPVTLLFASLFTGLAMTWWLRRRARYRFPEFDVEPRLGGAHAAGVGAVISFASAALPPASQKDQMPDYLRRY